MFKKINIPLNLNFKLNCDYFCHIVGVCNGDETGYYNIGDEYVFEISGVPRMNRAKCVFLYATYTINDFYAYLSHCKSGIELMGELSRDFPREKYYIMLFKNLPK